MSSEYNTLPNSEGGVGLPPVEPPSGKFLAQLFLVPLLIVGVLALLSWGLIALVGGSRSPEQFLEDLRNPNAEVRWRAASDLAQVLTRDRDLAANPGFNLDLAELLHQAISESRKQDEGAQAARRTQGVPPNGGDIGGQRDFIQFLIPCLGNCSLPTGLPILEEIASTESGADPATVALPRQLAVWALANLGDKLKHIDQMDAVRQQETVDYLRRESEESSGQLSSSTVPAERRVYAKKAFEFMTDPAARAHQIEGVVDVLAGCAKAQDPVLRKMVAFALNIWDGDDKANKVIDTTLLKLSYDDGHGASEDARLRGLEIRYKAVEGLARRASPELKKRLGILKDMLAEPVLDKDFTQDVDGRAVVDQEAVVSTLIGGLRSIAELHRKQPNYDLSEFTPLVSQLAQNENASVRVEAQKTQITLSKS